MVTIINVISFAVMLTGLIIAIQATKRHKNFGFAIIGLYFALSLLSSGIARFQEFRYNQQVQHYQQRSVQGMTQVQVKKSSVPVFPAILVAGVWIVARNYKKADSEQCHATVSDTSGIYDKV